MVFNKGISPWSSTSRKGIDSLAVWLIPTISHPADFTFIYHHQVTLVAQIAMTLLHHSSLSDIALGRSSRGILTELLDVGLRRSTRSGASMRGAHRSTSLISSLLLQQCPACLVRLSLMVCVIGGKSPYSCFFVGVLLPGFVQGSTQYSGTTSIYFIL